jgi:transcription antitermination factor NusG
VTELGGAFTETKKIKPIKIIEMFTEKKWYAVYTKSRCEKKVAQQLSQKGIEHYCPLNRVQKQWSDRKKIIFEPLFNSYVFVRINSEEQLAVRQTSGILNFVYWLSKPAVIRNDEIDIIKQFLNEHSFVKLEKVKVNLNDLARIISGPFMEQEGQVVSIKNKKVKILLPSLGYLMYVEIETARIQIIRENASQSRQELWAH